MIVVDGTARRIRTPADALAGGMAYLPESREDDGLFLEQSLASNTTFADLRSVASRFGVLRLAQERARELLNLTSVEPPNPAAKVVSLSGGNQQKVLFARWLLRNPRVLRSPAWPSTAAASSAGSAPWRTVLGVLMLGMITNGFDLLAVPDYWQNIVRGILIIIAVAIGFVIERR